MKLYISYHTGFTPEQLERLASLGFEVTVGDRLRERDRLPPEALDAEALLCFRVFDTNSIDGMKSLRVIHTTSAGLDHMPLRQIRERDIALYNASGVYSAPMAEYALMCSLWLLKHMPDLSRRRRERVWQTDYGLGELSGKRVLIAGAGSIGGETARRFSAMGCRVTGFCRHPSPREHFDDVLGMASLDAALPEGDIVILCLPLTDETRHLMNAERFARMKKGAILVNMARGPIVDTAALIDALESGRLLGAAADVFEQEPLPQDSPLWYLPNLILTPHNSFSGDGNNDRLFELVCRNLSGWLRENS